MTNPDSHMNKVERGMVTVLLLGVIAMLVQMCVEYAQKGYVSTWD